MIDTSLIGLELPAATTEVEADRVTAYANAVGETNPAYPVSAAEAAGKLAPPTFAAVYALSPPERKGGLGLPPQRLVHGEQEFEWRRAVSVGERLTTTARVADVYQKRSLQFMVVEGTSKDERGEVVCISRATILILPEAGGGEG